MENPFVAYLKSQHPNYLQILAQNESYILAVPPPDLVPAQPDEKLILEHIFQLPLAGKTLSSLIGTQYKLRKQQLKSKHFSCKVKQRDIAFTEDKQSYKRMLIDNILDDRYYVG